MDLINKEVIITYRTKPGKPVSGPVLPETNANGKVTNSVEFYHSHESGTGGPVWDPSPEWMQIKKEVEYDYSPVKKTADGYDPATQTIDWRFEINRRGVQMKSFTLTDEFDPEKQILLLN